MTTLIGQSLARPDALGKVTGATHYPGDLARPGMLHLKVVFGRRPHARIVSVDTTAALAHPGVVAVLTAADVPFNAFGLIEPDQPVLCGDKIRFEGDKVALVVAETREAAEAGAALVAITFEDLPVVSDAALAIQAGAPLVHEQRGTNVLFAMPIRKGDTTRALATADVVVEERFQTSWQEHAFLQPEAGIAFIEDDGRLVIETAGQWLHEDRRQLAHMLQIDEDLIVVRYAAIGGAFGGREDLSIQHLLALAAWKLQRPVSLVWNRSESIIGHHKRHPFTIQCRWGATRAGIITAVEATLVADGGAYASTSQEVVKCAAIFATGPYEIANVQVDACAVYTNNVPSGAFRGFGAPQAHFAAEIMVDRLAAALGMEAAELRRRNLYREGSFEPTGQPLPAGVGIRACLERCMAEMRERGFGTEPPVSDHMRRGVGLACGIKNVGYSFGYPEQSTATVELWGEHQIKRALIRIGAADVGQGAQLALCQIAAETLGLAFEQVDLLSDDSSQAPNAGSASASRLTLMAGRAVLEAARAALRQWQEEERPARATVQYRPPATTALDPHTGYGRPNYCYGYAAQAVEVDVNTLTGNVQVRRVISVHDVGRAINRQQVEGQIEGCLAQALGYALLEHLQVYESRILTPHLSSYLLPTTLDMPDEIIPIILEEADPNGPFGARGMAEMPLVPLAAAISNAIADATGARLTQQPMTPERVLDAIMAGLPE